MYKRCLIKLMRIGITVIMVSLLISIVSIVGATAGEEKVYELKANIIGPGPIGVKKAENIELAAERLNQMLESRYFHLAEYGRISKKRLYCVFR